MDENKHYYRLDASGFVIYAFSDAFEQPLENDFLFETGGRQFNPIITNERYQYIYKVVNDEVIERTQEELDAEWEARPPAPKSPDQIKIEMLTEQLTQQSMNSTAFMEFVLQTLGVE